MAGDPWTFNVTPAFPSGSIVITDGTTSVDISPMTVMGDTYSTDAFISDTTVSMEFTHEDYPDVVFKPQTAVVGTTTNVNFIPTMLYAWSSNNSGTFPSTVYTWSDDIINDDINGFAFWANYHNGTADDITDDIINEDPSVVDATSFELTVDSDAVYTRDSSKDVVTTTQTVANLSDGTNTYEIEDSQARDDIQEIQSNYVTTDTAQTISGEKTLTANLYVNDRNIHMRTDFAKGTAPDSDYWKQYTVCDNSGSTSNDHKLGGFVVISSANGAQQTRLLAFRNITGDTSSTNISVGYLADGTIYTNAPACSITNSIVTTTAISKSSNGYVKLGNGIIIQWGNHSTSSAGASTITFPTAFTSANYAITLNRSSGSSTTNDSGSYYIRGRTTTTASVYKTNNNTQALLWIAVGY